MRGGGWGGGDLQRSRHHGKEEYGKTGGEQLVPKAGGGKVVGPSPDIHTGDEGVAGGGPGARAMPIMRTKAEVQVSACMHKC